MTVRLASDWGDHRQYCVLVCVVPRGIMECALD